LNAIQAADDLFSGFYFAWQAAKTGLKCVLCVI